jgi:photosystem II stability/assembly factor-like uncharacterized protein
MLSVKFFPAYLLLVLTLPAFGVPGAPALAQGGWTTVGPRDVPNSSGLGLPAAGKINAVSVDQANPRIIYAAGGTGPGNSGPSSEAGIYMTANDGINWSTTDNGLSDVMVGALWLDQANTNILLAGTWFNGIFRTQNAGNTWTQVYNQPTTTFVQTGSTLYAATAAGVAQSNDIGTSWSLTEPASSPVRALVSGGTALYAGLENGTIIARFNTADNWHTLRTQSGATVWSLALNPQNTAIAYAVEWIGSGTPDLYQTTNSGATWSPISALQSVSIQYVALNSTNPSIVYAAGGGHIYKSTDAASTFTQLGLNIDPRLVYPVQNSGTVIVGSDQGIYQSTDAGKTWTSLNWDLSTNLLTGLAVNGSTIFTAVQDFSPTASFDGGASWLQLWNVSAPVGEDGVVAINPNNPRYVYAFTISGFQWSSDGGHTFKFSLPSSEWAFSGGTSDLVAFDPVMPGTLYVAAKDGVFKSTNYGSTMTQQPWPYTQTTLIAVDPELNNTVFVGTGNGLFVTFNGGSNWSQVTLPIGQGWPTTVAVDPNNSAIVIAGMAYGDIARSVDSGRTFVNSSSGIVIRPAPTLTQVWDVSFDTGSETVAAATTGGPYVSADKGSSWSSLQLNAIPFWFTDLAWSGGNLYASTYGEGVLGLALTCSVNCTVGGNVLPIEKWALLIPYIGLASAVLIGVAVSVILRNRRVLQERSARP